MSKENVELVRGIWEADRRRDWGAAYAVYAEDVVWEDHAGLWGDWGEARGPNGIQQAWRRWHEAFENVQFEFGEVADAADIVVVTYCVHARGPGSGIELHQPITLVWTFAAGKVVRIRAYLSRREAMEAVGLPRVALRHVLNFSADERSAECGPANAFGAYLDAYRAAPQGVLRQGAGKGQDLFSG